MSFIEGIGDEVVLFCIIVVVFTIAALVTLIGNRPSVRQISPTRQHSGRASEQDLQVVQQIFITLLHMIERDLYIVPEVIASAVSRNEDTQVSLRSEYFEGGDREITENNESISENDVVSNSNEEHTVEETDDTNNVGNASLTSTSAEQDTTEDINRDIQTNVDNLQHTSSNSDANVVRNTDAVEGFEQLTSEIPSAPPLEENRASDRGNLQPPPPGEIRIRLKYLNDTERTVTSSPDIKIGDFKSKHFSEDIRNNKVVRLIFAGRLLNNNSTIQNCRILDNSVVHVQVLQAPTPTAPEASQEAELDLGRLLWPVLTAILGFMWMTYLKYPEFYNLMSLGILLLFTGSFFFFLSHAQH